MNQLITLRAAVAAVESRRAYEDNKSAAIFFCHAVRMAQPRVSWPSWVSWDRFQGDTSLAGQEGETSRQ